MRLLPRSHGTGRAPRRASHAAFTLIELLTVIAIIGILAAIVIPTVGTVREKAQRAVDANSIREILKAAQIYAGENQDRLPDPQPTSIPNTVLNAPQLAWKWPGILAKNNILTDPTFYFAKNDPAFNGTYPTFIIQPSAARNTLHTTFTQGRSPSWEFVGGVKMSDSARTPVIYTRGLQANGTWSATSGVYKDTGGEPQFLQLLPSGVGPEGLVAVPSRNLLVTANEVDLVEDGGARSHVMIYERAEGPAKYPMIVADRTAEGVPLGWGAVSGLAADPSEPGKLFAVSDSFYKGAPAIFAIDATQTPARITGKTPVTRDGHPAQKLDLEGIVADGKGGFWLASEGNSATLTPHAVFHVGADGAIDKEIAFPAELLAGEIRFGLEGITTVGEGDDLMLVMAVQREWKDDPQGHVKLLAYKPAAKEWSAVRYPLDATEAGWMGLSEVTAHDGKLLIVERDNLIGSAAKAKKIYSVALEGFKPAALGGELPMVQKTLVRDLIPDLKAAGNGYVVDKVEGFAVDANGEAFVVTDNDGVDNSSGETLFLRLGKIDAVN